MRLHRVADATVIIPAMIAAVEILPVGRSTSTFSSSDTYYGYEVQVTYVMREAPHVVATFKAPVSVIDPTNLRGRRQLTPEEYGEKLAECEARARVVLEGILEAVRAETGPWGT